jgi:orotidine-5'-phosphate decarboxylase
MIVDEPIHINMEISIAHGNPGQLFGEARTDVDNDRPDPLIVALDFDSSREADELVDALGDSAGFYKVGMELFAAAGMDYVRSLTGRGKRVFLDMKYYDIGETVKRAVGVAARSGASFLTVHAVGQVMRAALEGRGDSDMKLLAVTVLTSLDEADIYDMGHYCTVSELVERRVAQAMEAGMDGIVASPLEARAIRSLAGPEAILVTPGVRSSGTAQGDQKRVATPAEAIRDGADYLVIGRQVTRAADPVAALGAIRDEIREESRARNASR